jgi:hypothetical protein
MTCQVLGNLLWSEFVLTQLGWFWLFLAFCVKAEPGNSWKEAFAPIITSLSRNRGNVAFRRGDAALRRISELFRMAGDSPLPRTLKEPFRFP